MARRGATALAATVLAVLAGTLPAGAPRAQRLESWLRGTPLTFSTMPPSYRLRAMGALAVSVEDENNEITLLDYAHNIAGLLEDRPQTTIDAWGRDTPWTTQAAEDVTLSEYNAFVAARRPGRFAVGLVTGRAQSRFTSPGYSAADLRWSALRAQLVLKEEGEPHTDPNPDTLYGRVETASIDSSIAVDTGRPLYGLSYNMLIGRRVAFAVSETYSHEAEQTGRTLRYSTEYSSRTWNSGAALAVRVIPGVTVGGTLNYLDTKLRGLADGLQFQRGMAHYDKFTEAFPTWRRGVHAFVTYGSLLNGALLAERTSGHGSEKYEINWPDLVALQRTGGSVTAKGTRFEDDASGSRYGTRWAFHPFGPRYMAGLSFDRTRDHVSRLDVAPVVVETSRGQDSTVYEFGNTITLTTAWAAALGGSVSLPGRGVVGLEFVRGHASVRDSSDALSPTHVEPRTRGLRGGLEFWVLPRLAARAGFQRLTSIDTADHLNEVTAGAGYTFRGRITADLVYTRATSSREAETALPPRPTVKTHTLALIGRWDI